MAVIGAGIVGIATAYHLKQADEQLSVVLIDCGEPMALTSAQSGENYRNWWPSPVMKAFADRSIDLMEALAEESGGRFAMSRRGYILATRAESIDPLLDDLRMGYGDEPGDALRIHDSRHDAGYRPPDEEDWQTAPGGVDVLLDRAPIRRHFPWYDPALTALLHIRRGGAVDSQQMGQVMLERFRQAGGRRLRAHVVGLEARDGFVLRLEGAEPRLRARRIVNAAGPFMNELAGMLGERLPVRNLLQQKIAFDDRAGAIPRGMPFSIDLDGQQLDWSDDEREALAADPDLGHLAGELPGGVHCRPEGGDGGTWLKLGWAINETDSQASREPALDESFPEIVLRAAARLNPALRTYYGCLPRSCVHYGGYYTMTEENRPLIGPMAAEGAYVVGAMSGFGTMAACAAGELCAAWITGGPLPDYGPALAPGRYDDPALMAELGAQRSRGIL